MCWSLFFFPIMHFFPPRLPLLLTPQVRLKVRSAAASPPLGFSLEKCLFVRVANRDDQIALLQMGSHCREKPSIICHCSLGSMATAIAAKTIRVGKNVIVYTVYLFIPSFNYKLHQSVMSAWLRFAGLHLLADIFLITCCYFLVSVTYSGWCFCIQMSTNKWACTEKATHAHIIMSKKV